MFKLSETNYIINLIIIRLMNKYPLVVNLLPSYLVKRIKKLFTEEYSTESASYIPEACKYVNNIFTDDNSGTPYQIFLGLVGILNVNHSEFNSVVQTTRKNLLIEIEAYIKVNASLVLTLTGLTTKSIVNVLNESLKALYEKDRCLISNEEYLSLLMTEISNRYHLLSPIKSEEWLANIIMKDNLLVLLDDLVCIPVIGKIIKDKIIKSLGLKLRGDMKILTLFSFPGVLRSNLKTDKDGNLLSVGKLLLGKGLILQLTRKKGLSGYFSRFTDGFLSVFRSKKKPTVEQEPEQDSVATA